jgi:hypothetical protein
LRLALAAQVVFVSHQWLAAAEPDPRNVHYPAIVDALDALCAKLGVHESKCYCWVDVSAPCRARSGATSARDARARALPVAALPLDCLAPSLGKPRSLCPPC